MSDNLVILGCFIPLPTTKSTSTVGIFRRNSELNPERLSTSSASSSAFRPGIGYLNPLN